MILGYHSPFSIFELLDNLIVVVGVGRLYCLFTYGRKVEVGNKPGRFLWVCTKEDVTDTDIPMIDPKVTEGPKALGRHKCLVHSRGTAHIPSAAHSAALSKSTRDVYDTMLRPRVASTTR